MRSTLSAFSRARTTPLVRLFSSAATTTSCATKAKRVVITGANGQIGVDLAADLRARFGANNVLCTDIRRPEGVPAGPFQYLDVTDGPAVNKAVVDFDADYVVHLASMLSAVGEKNPQAAMRLNTRGIENVLETARLHNVRVFAPSTIAVFGNSTPRNQTPDATVMEPSTMYGVTKIYLENLSSYYRAKFGVDVRSVRFPGVISNTAMAGGGTTDYAVDIYHKALLDGRYTCFLRADSELPMMYSPDSTAAAVQLLLAPKEKLTQVTYNVTGVSFTPAEVAAAIKERIPAFEMDYAPDFRQAIADSWPASLDDSNARRDWGWAPQFDLEAMTDDMLRALREKYGIAPGQEGKGATR